jgi:uncharacterized protein YgfB (UPF0149 family)
MSGGFWSDRFKTLSEAASALLEWENYFILRWGLTIESASIEIDQSSGSCTLTVRYSK